MSNLSGVVVDVQHAVSRSDAAGYDGLSKLLHWFIALAVLAMLAFGFYLDSLPFSKDKVALIQSHKSVGIVLALFVLLRVARRIRNGFLPGHKDESRIQRLIAGSVHVLLLLLPIGMVFTGVLRSLAYGRSVKVFGADFIPVVMEKNEALHTAARNAHAAIAWLFIACIVLHTAAALWHHFVKRDTTLRRMLPAPSARRPAAIPKVAR